jgi:AraC-like DNA-binding protein
VAIPAAFSLSRDDLQLNDHGMSTLEAALRGGAVVVLLLRVAVLVRNARNNRVNGYSAAMLTGIAAYVVASAPGFGALDPRWRFPIHILSVSTPAAFWMTMGAVFDDAFRARWYHAVAWLALATLAAWEMSGHSIAIGAIQSALSLLLVLLGIWHALAGRAADLVEKRRRLRVLSAVAVALYTVLIIASDWLWPRGLSAAPLTLANAIGLMALIFLFSVLDQPASSGEQSAPARARAKSTQSPTQSPADDRPAAPLPTGAEAGLLQALRQLMEHGKVYREADLSIASLSQKLDVPEHRLRRLINRQLGHRNFSTFVNGYRLGEAEAALADPAQAEVPILTIALDAGFGSIGPFNRAFKAHAGRTPTEYRRARLDDGQAGGSAPPPESASRF